MEYDIFGGCFEKKVIERPFTVWLFYLGVLEKAV